MAIVVEVPSEFDQNLPYFIPDPVLGVNDLIYRFVSESLGAPGPISSWFSGPGGPSHELYMTTAANYPSVVQDGARRVVRFDGVNDLMTVRTPVTMTTCTLYFVAKFATVDTARHILLNLTGANIGIDGSKIRVSGTGSSQLTSTTDVVAGEWIVFAVAFNGTTLSLSYKSEAISGTVTLSGALSTFSIGGTGGLLFGGDIHELIAFDSVHDAATRAQQMNQLRDWYNAA